MARVIFVNRYFHPDFSATSQMLGDLAFGLAERGWQISVVTSRQIYDQPQAGLRPQELIAGVSVHRVTGTRFGRVGVLGRLCDYLSFHVAAAFKLRALLAPGDVVVAKTDPPLLGVTAGWIARTRKAHSVNWLQDLFPEVLGAVAGKRAVARAFIELLKGLRNRALMAAQRNVTIGERMRRHLQAQGVNAALLTLIENWSDGQLVVPHDRRTNPLRLQWGLKQQLVVGYSGNLGVAHEFVTILGAAELLQHRADVSFLFIGGGSRLAWLQQQVAQRELRNVQFQPYQRRELLPQSLSVPDVHLVCLRADMEGLVVPSKFYGVLAAGRACIFIGDLEGEIALQLRKLDCGVAVRPGEVDELAGCIEMLANNPAQLEALGARARTAFERDFDRSVGVDKWARLLAEVSRA